MDCGVGAAQRYMNGWWPRLESNQRHPDFQSGALPTELRGQRRCVDAAGIEPTQAYFYAGDLQSLELNQCSAHPRNVLRKTMVPKEGLEPSRPFGHRHLKPARLPISPPGQVYGAAPAVAFYRRPQPGGSGGIRTLEPRERFAVFKAAALGHSATLPGIQGHGPNYAGLRRQLFIDWQRRKDSNLRMPESKSGALTSLATPLDNWSGKRDSNSRPQPWQGCALPTELFPRKPFHRSASFPGALVKRLW